jgi:hypothetical protein
MNIFKKKNALICIYFFLNMFTILNLNESRPGFFYFNFVTQNLEKLSNKTAKLAEKQKISTNFPNVPICDGVDC